MSSSKTQDYDVEKIISKRTDNKGRISYLIKWKGYSTENNTWEPESHVNNCQDLIKAFEIEEVKKNKSKNYNSNASSQGRISPRTTRSSLPPSKKSINKNERSTRNSKRNSPIQQQRKRASSDDSIYIEQNTSNGDIGKKSNTSVSSKRLRKTTTDSDMTSSTDDDEIDDDDILDKNKLDNILDVRRNKKNNTIEYHIQAKKTAKPLWIKSNRLTEDYAQEIIDFLEEKYV